MTNGTVIAIMLNKEVSFIITVNKANRNQDKKIKQKYVIKFILIMV